MVPAPNYIQTVGKKYLHVLCLSGWGGKVKLSTAYFGGSNPVKMAPFHQI